MLSSHSQITLASLFLRWALAVTFLSACADRFGIWGPPGASRVAWGDWQNFVNYVAVLNWFVPAALHAALAWTATVAEIVIALGLMSGWQLRKFGFASGVLLLLFALTMTFSVGIKPPLDFSVWTAAAASFLLAAGPEKAGSAKHD